MNYTFLRALVQTLSLVGVVLLIGPLPALSQDATRTSDAQAEKRRACVAVGIGNTFGWLGAAGEFYLKDSHASAVIGIGYWPSQSLRGVAYALALRGYLGGRKHRLFVEGSWSDLSRADWYESGSDEVRVEHQYGPGLSGGYQYTAGSGVTVLMAGGAGWDFEYSELVTILNLGVGYTWRR